VLSLHPRLASSSRRPELLQSGLGFPGMRTVAATLDLSSPDSDLVLSCFSYRGNHTDWIIHPTTTDPMVALTRTKWPDIYAYARSVEVYRQRDLTYPNDVLNAFRVFTTIYGRTMEGAFLCGLPELSSILHYSDHWDEACAEEQIAEESHRNNFHRGLGQTGRVMSGCICIRRRRVHRNPSCQLFGYWGR
jgi:hypothetical protein